MRFLPLLVTVCVLTSCSAPVALEEPKSSSEEVVISESTVQEEPEQNYILAVTGEIISGHAPAGSSQADKALWAYEYLIETTVIDQPVGLDIWRYRGGENDPPDFIENRALSPLVFGIGSCEDYAAALTLLLRQMGMSAEYVPGITVSAQGGFVDHAWIMAEIDGVWYHLDPHLEDTILKDNTLVYKYFMKSDQTMLASHRWGENLIAFGGLTEAQAAEIRGGIRYPKCPEDYPPPPFKVLSPAVPPDRETVAASVEQEKERYEREHGPLPPRELDIIPPVFRGETYTKLH